jgi:hypothetical protein
VSPDLAEEFALFTEESIDLADLVFPAMAEQALRIP